MKRSIAFLLAMIMVIGMVPVSLLPALAHGIGVGANDVQNLSLDNAPNQKIPATVTVDGLVNDTAWKMDEWQVADSQYGIWDTTPIDYPDFTYRYQLHLDYEFVYGVIEWDTSKIAAGKDVDNYTIWLNDGSNSDHYTAKVVLTDGGEAFSLDVFHYGSNTAFESLADMTYEESITRDSVEGTVKVLEFKVFLEDILGKEIKEETELNLSSFVSAEINSKRFYHPHIEAARENQSVDLAGTWPAGKAVSITQNMIYADSSLTDAEKELTHNNAGVTEYGVNVDGKFDEVAWKNFTNYGGSGYETYRDYERFGDRLIANYDVEYSTEYRHWEGEPAESINGMDGIWYHQNNAGATYAGYYNPEFTPGCYTGHIGNNHTCTAVCENNYINNIPVKFKYNVKCDGTYVYGAVVANVSVDNEEFYNSYYDGTETGQKTYFKVMYAGEAQPGVSNPYVEYGQLELEHTLRDPQSIHSYSTTTNNTRVLTSTVGGIKDAGKDSEGNSIMPSGVGAYARRIDSNTMVFEFCISLAQMNANTTCNSNYKEYAEAYDFGLNKQTAIIITVANQSTGCTTVGPCAGHNSSGDTWEDNPYAGGVHATSGGYFAHAGLYDVLGRKNTHRYTFDGSDPAFSPALANGSLDRGIFNGLLATDRFINAAYRQMGNRSAENTIDYASPAIPVNAGTTVLLSKYNVEFSSGTSTKAENITWTDANGNAITTVTTTTKGVTKVTATITGTTTTKTIYIVAKNPEDSEYVLYETKFDGSTTLDTLTADGWHFPEDTDNVSIEKDHEDLGDSATAGYDYKVLSIGAAGAYSGATLPRWLYEFGDYNFYARASVEEATNDQRWFSLVTRADQRPSKHYATTTYDAEFVHFAVRQNAAGTNGVEIVDRYENSSGSYNWGYLKQGSAPSSYSNLIDERYHWYKISTSGNSIKTYIDNKLVLETNEGAKYSGQTRGYLGFITDRMKLNVYKVRVTLKTDAPLTTNIRNEYNNSITTDPGAIQYFDYDIFMDTEYLYGAAVVKKNGYDTSSSAKSTAFDDDDSVNLWINNGVAQWRDKYDYVVKFYLGKDGFKFSPNETYSDIQTSVSNPTGDAMNKEAEGFETSSAGIEYKRTPITAEMYEAGAAKIGTDNSKEFESGDMVLIEFKIPLESIGVSEKYNERTSSGKSESAVSYFISAESQTNGSTGIVSPIPNPEYLNGKDEDYTFTGNKIWSLAFYDEENASCGSWISTIYSGVDGCKFIRGSERTNTFVVDGILSDVIWNDDEERINVDSYNGTWSVVPDADNLFGYKYKAYTGREYIYGMAEIDTVAKEGEELDFTLWIKNDADATKATNKFRIVQNSTGAVCYDFNDVEHEMSYEETRWESGHDETYVLELTTGKVAMTNDGEKTYVEFMFSLEGMEIVTHESGEDVWSKFVGGGYGSDSATYYPDSDKFYYQWDSSSETFTANKKNGFEYFVSVTRKTTSGNETIENTLYYPSLEGIEAVHTPDASNEYDKYCHLGKWDSVNAHVITPTGYFVPETIDIDGDITDSGWDEDRWIEVIEGVNGNLQNIDYEAATVTDYKYQVRVDNEYVYVAVVINTPASTVRYDVDGSVTYSKPNVKFWIKSKDKDYSVNVNHNGEGNKTYTYTDEENAVSFTHLYDLSLATSRTTGEATTTVLDLTKSNYDPSNYVTWEPTDVTHEAGSKHASIDGDTIIYNGTTVRFTSHDTGFYAPYGGNPRPVSDPLGALSYTVTTKDGSYTVDSNTNSKGKYLTNHESTKYESSALFGYTEVIEENTVTAKGENAYTDKDWYAKPQIDKYTYGNEHGIVTSDITGTKTHVEFKFALSEIGCEDGDEFEYYIQAGTTGSADSKGYSVFNPPIGVGFDKRDGYGDTKEGRPNWYWGTNAVVVNDAAKEYMALNNGYAPISGIGAQYTEKYPYNGKEYNGIKFGVLYNSDYIRQPGITDEDNPYKNANYWDVKEIGMLIGDTDVLEGDVTNLVNEKADGKDIIRIESDMIVDQLVDTNMADYENYIFYAIRLLNNGKEDKKYTYRGYMEYYPEDQIYYDMASKIFADNSNYEGEGQFKGKPLTMEGVNGDPTKIPAEWTFRETYYSEPITRSINMIKYVSKNFTNSATGDNLVDTNKTEAPKIEAQNNTPIVYVPIDNRPVNLERVQYQAEAAGFRLVMPPESMISAMLESEAEGKSDQGNPKELYNWLYERYYTDKYKYFVISVDEMLSGGLVGSREPFGDDDSIANSSVLANYNIETGGYTLSDDENKIIDLLKTIASADDTYTVYFDTVKRLACTSNYRSYSQADYSSYRNYGSLERKQLYGSDLTIENIVAGYNYNQNGDKIASVYNQWMADNYPLTGNYADYEINKSYIFNYYGTHYGIDAEEFKEFIAARERKLRIADALYPTLVADADMFYVGYDDSKPYTTIQTNEGRYIEEKLIKGDENTKIFSATDELGVMGIATVVTHLYGSVSANVEFFGPGKDWAGDDYDTGTLYQNVMTHISSIGATYSYDGEGDVDILILTRADGGEEGGEYTSAEVTALKQYAGKLIDRVAENLEKNKPTIVIDCAFEDGYLATMMMQRTATDTHDNDISKQLGELLAYSHWGTTANSLGIALSNGISRYTYLKNSPEITEASHMAAIKAHVEAWVKDYGYRTGDSSGSLSSDHPYVSGKPGKVFADEYNNFWELTDVIMSKLNSSDIIVGVNKATGKTVLNKDYVASVSDLRWPWDRYHEARYDIDVQPIGTATPDYNDYKVTNLALGKSYSTSWASNTYEDYENAELTNGVRVYPAASGYGYGSTPYWGGWTFEDSTDAEYFDITIDLGGIYPVYQVNLDNLSMGLKSDGTATQGMYTPSKLQLLTSTTKDGEYTLQRTLTLEGQESKGVYRYYLGTDCEAAEAQFVKVRVWKNTSISNATWFLCSEIEVLGLDGTRAEYVDATGLNFTYSVPADRDPYNIYDGTGYEPGYMTYDDGDRLRMYYDGTTYTSNMVNPDKVFKYSTDADGSKANLSGWKLAEGKGDEIPFTLDIDGNAAVTQIGVHVSADIGNIPKPQYAKLYMVQDGTETLIPTNLIITPIYKGGSSNNNGYRCIVEIAEEGLYVPDDATLKLCLGREADNNESNAYILAGIQIIGRKGNVYADSEIVTTDATVKYDFIGDEAKMAGFAQGIITVTPVDSTTTTGNYLVYYTGDDGILTGYDEIASIPITGSAVSYEVPDGIMIPEGATGIAVFESSNAFEDSAPDLDTAVAQTIIPANKLIDLGDAEVIFGAASDTHMNYEYYGNRNAHAKWANALDFFKKNGASYVIVTGDMTGDEGEKGHELKEQYDDYVNIIEDSGIPLANVYEALGNHGALSSDLPEFTVLNGTDQVHPYTDSPYYHVVKEGGTGEKDNVFIFMYLEMDDTKVSDDPSFLTAQIDWLDGLLTQYDNEDNNVFVICHAPFLNYGAGDRYNGGGYTDLLKIDGTYTENDRFKGILQEHRDVIVMSGHTHLTFYDGANYSNVNNEFAHTVHVSSTCWPRAYTADGSSCPAGTDGRYSADTADYGSEAYLVSVYKDYIVYTGYNLSTGKVIPAACFIIPTESAEALTPDEAFEGSGTEEDPYLIQDAQDFLLLTNGFNANEGADAANGYGYGKYFLQTADIDLSEINAYNGTYAGTYNGAEVQHKSNFAGTYNGNGYSITVAIDGYDQRSVFPYVYGTLVNVTIKGSIVSKNTVAQPVRSIREGASLINCYFDIDLSGAATHGAVYSNNGYIYNVYSSGVQVATGNDYGICQGVGEGVTNAYYSADGIANVEIGTYVSTDNIDTVINAFNDRDSAEYTTAIGRLGFGIQLCDVSAVNGELVFEHN